MEGAEVSVPAVACPTVGFVVFFLGLLVVGFNDAGNVRHTAVTDLKCVPIEYSV